MNRNQILAALAGVLILSLGVFAYIYRADIPILNPQGPVGSEERWIILLTLLLCAFVVVPVYGMLVFFALRYRDDKPKAKREHDPAWDHENVVAELFWWFPPAVIILILGTVAWRSSHDLDPYRPLASAAKPLEVQVVAMDWKWLFIYPEEGIATVNELEFPAGTPVHFDITADAPMNSFWIPSLGGQIMAMPGMSNQLSLMANRPGEYRGYSANISGEGFAGMEFAARSVPQAQFEQWVATVRASNNPLTLNAYKALEAPTKYQPVTYYAPVDVNLYTDIITKFARPGGLVETHEGSEQTP